jgi:hypothetical protein
MMKTSETIWEDGEIVTGTGRVFRPGRAELLEALPPDIVREMAKRRLEETARYKAERADTETQE